MFRSGSPAPPTGRPIARAALTLAGLLCLVAASASAGVAERVADIHPGPATGGSDTEFWQGDFEPFGGLAYFTADDGVHGNELWATDGTLAGTALVVDVCPGVCSSNPLYLTAAGGQLFFSASDGAHGTELWVSDGTAAGTRMVVDLAPGLGSSFPDELIDFGGSVIFRGNGLVGRLWISDGTAAGTRHLGSTDPSLAPSGAVPLALFDGKLVLAAADAAHGMELWTTDGTPAGTGLLVDIHPGPSSSINLQSSGSAFRTYASDGTRLFLAADDGVHGTELWVTDGTAAGTAMVADIDPGTSGSSIQGMAIFDDSLYFGADDGVHGRELWTTDGTAAGTTLWLEIRPGVEGSHPRELEVAGDSLFFNADDGVHGTELWVSDGTAGGTTMVTDLFPGADSSTQFFSSITRFGDGVVTFFADDGIAGTEPWISDGTAAGTQRLADVAPGADSSYFAFVTFSFDRREVIGGEWYFRAWGPESGVEPWITDGTPAGTRQIAINHQSSAFRISAVPNGSVLLGPVAIAEHNGRLLFAADDGVHGTELWRTDGTGGGTELVRDIVPGSEPSLPSAIRSAGLGAVFSALSPQCCGTQGWISDGSDAGTEPVADAPWPQEAARLGDRVYFLGDDSLWHTDGTVGGTGALDLVADWFGGLTRAGDWIYFGGAPSGSDPAEAELWRTDGLVTEPVAEIGPGTAGGRPSSLLEAAGTLFFSADDGVHGRELWASNGTAAGTRLVRDVRPGPESGLGGDPWHDDLFGGVGMAAAGGRAFYLADDGVHGEELWVSDGKPAGTFLLADVFPGPRSSEIRWLTGLAGRVVFVAEDGVHGRELWVSDGTVAGTKLLADLIAGPGSSLPDQLRAAGGRIFFAAHTPSHGREPWATDGTPAGTVRLDDIAPGPLPSSPLSFTEADGWLYFAATDGTTGFELWRLPLTVSR